MMLNFGSQNGGFRVSKTITMTTIPLTLDWITTQVSSVPIYLYSTYRQVTNLVDNLKKFNLKIKTMSNQRK